MMEVEVSAMLHAICELFGDFLVVAVLVLLVLAFAGSVSDYRPLPPLLDSGVTAPLTPAIR
jgi:hypothetical protein